MANPSDITTAFKSTLAAEFSVAAIYDYVPSNVATPCFIAQYPTEVEYDFEMGDDVTRWSFPLQLLVGRYDERSAWTGIADYLAADGVKAVLEADPTLDGVVQSLRVTEAEVVVYTIAGNDYLAAIFTIDVVA